MWPYAIFLCTKFPCTKFQGNRITCLHISHLDENKKKQKHSAKNIFEGLYPGNTALVWLKCGKCGGDVGQSLNSKIH